MLCQSAPDTTQVDPSIYIDGTLLKSADSFNYFGSIISNDGSLDKETTYRISKAGQDLGRLPNKVLGEHNIKLFMKVKVFLLPFFVALRPELSTTNIINNWKMSIPKPFHMQVHPWHLMVDSITNLTVLERADCNSINPILLKA